MNKDFYQEFMEGSSKAWKQKIQVDLKGADYNDTLIWKTEEGIDVKPFYHSDEFKTLTIGPPTKATNWKIAEEMHVMSVEESNLQAVNAISNGTEIIIFKIRSEDINLENLLKNINRQRTHVYIKCTFLSSKFVELIANINESTKHSDAKPLVVLCDIIYNLAKSGNWYSDLKRDHTQFENIVKTTEQLSVNTALYQNAGATIVQQLVYGLAHANEYLNHFDHILTPESKKNLKTTFIISIGSNYFFEIAKIRALRQLWTVLAEQYGLNSNCTILAQPSKRNKTIYDYNINMLRTTTECMSAILGGADIICNLPYDALYHNSNEFGNRIARNQLLVLKHESYFDKVNNPADGAYYIESLTSQFTEKGLELFKTIESNGGFLHHLKQAKIQKKIKESAQKEQIAFNNGEITLLGTNKHTNPSDKMKNNLEKNPFLSSNPRKTLIEPIIEKRLSEGVEQKRLKDE